MVRNRRCMISVGMCVVLCMATGLLRELSAVEEDKQLWAHGLPKSMLKNVIAMLHINKPQELIGTIESTATDAGITMDSPLKFIAKYFYHSRNVSGVDIDRPMVVMWRKGRAEMSAIIPIYDRKLFFNNFARVKVMNGVMVRIGEKEGTTVYMHNTPDGMIEYRLLVRDHTAYFARNKHECELLAESELKQEVDKPFLRFYIDKPYDFLPHFDEFIASRNNKLITEIGSVIVSEYNLLLQQLRSIEITAEILTNKTFRVQTLVEVVQESALHMWISRQQNQSSRLLSVLDYPQSVLALYGNVSWSGGIKEMGVRIAKIIERSYPLDAQAIVMAKAFSSWCALADRRGAFATTVHLNTPTEGVLDVRQVSLLEQTRALELVGYQQILDAHLAQYSEQIRASLARIFGDFRKQKPVEVSISDLTAIGDYQGYWLDPQQGQSDKRQLRQLRMASDAHYVELTSYEDKKSTSRRSLAIIEELETSATTPIGQAGIIVAHLNLHHILREISNLGGGIGYVIPVAEMHAALLIDNEDRLRLRLEIPVADTAKAIHASNWSAFANYINTLVSGAEE